MDAESIKNGLPEGLWGGRVARVRADRGWTQTELAFHAYLNAAEVSRFERGVRQPLAPVVARLARALGCSSDYLLGLTDDPSVKPPPMRRKDTP